MHVRVLPVSRADLYYIVCPVHGCIACYVQSLHFTLARARLLIYVCALYTVSTCTCARVNSLLAAPCVRCCLCMLRALHDLTYPCVAFRNACAQLRRALVLLFVLDLLLVVRRLGRKKFVKSCCGVRE